jgi:iron complex transport system substrate-binding protein
VLNRLRVWIAAAAVVATLGASEVQPRRIISIVPATTEILFAIGAGDRVLAVGTYDRVPPEASRLPRVGALLDPDVERILSFRPDLVVMYATQAELRTQLERAGVPLYLYEHRGLADIFDTIRALGARVNVKDQADALAGSIERQIAAVRKRVAAASRPRTLLVFGREPKSLRGIEASGGVGFLHDMLETAGGADVLADVKQQSVTMTTEMVLARAPEIIIEVRYSGEALTPSDLSAWSALGAVPAVRNHRVHALLGEQFVVPGPRVGEATEQLARTIHREIEW